MRRKAFIIATVAILLLLGVVALSLMSVDTFVSLKPKAVIVVLVNCLIYAGIGILLYRLFKKKA